VLGLVIYYYADSKKIKLCEGVVRTIDMDATEGVVRFDFEIILVWVFTVNGSGHIFCHYVI